MPPQNRPAYIWSQPTQYIVSILALAGSLLFVFYARNLLASLLIAALIASLLTPLTRIITRYTRFGHRAAANLVYLTFVVLVVAIPAMFAPFIISEVQSLAAELQTLAADMQSGVAATPDVFGIQLPLNEWLESFQNNTASYFVPTNFLTIANNISQNLIWILITLVTIYYLLQDWDHLREWVIRQAPDYRRDEVRQLYTEIRIVWQAYMRGQVVLMLLVGVTSWLGSTVVGLQGAWAVGLLAGVLDVIPSVGPAIASIVAVIVAWLTGSTYLPVSNVVFAVIVLAVFGVIQTIENIWWRPRIMGNSLHMHPALVFIGVMGSLALAGVFVTLIIIPVMGTVGVIGRYIRARMLGIEPEYRDVMRKT